MGDLIGIGLSGLRAHQTALSVTGNNVANTNTPGYSRQEAVFVDNPSIRTGAGYVGQGVNLSTIRRNAEEFVSSQLRADTTIHSERDVFLTQAQNIDNLLASTTTGLTPAMSAFFQAFQGGAEDPTSIPQRQLLLTQSEGLVSRFKSLDSRLDSQMRTIDFEMEAGPEQEIDRYRELWQHYFKVLGIEHRKNSKLQRQNLPIKMRNHMTEFMEA